MKHIYPKVTIVTVCYNAASNIEECMQSVVNQTFDSVEYIVIDGGSTDGTNDIIKKYADRLAYYISEPDKGIYDAMNKGLKQATGEWIGFINAGDKYFDNEVFAKVFEQPTDDWDLIYGDTEFIRKHSTFVEKSLPPSWLEKNMPTCHQSFFVRTKMAKEIMFDTRFKYAADYNMIYNIFQNSGVARTIHMPIVISTYDARWGCSMERPNAVYKETLTILRPSLYRTYGFFRYYVKKLIGRK